MQLQTLAVSASKLPSMFCHGGLFHPVKAFRCLLVLSCAFFCLAAYGLCSVNGKQNPPEYDTCASFGKSYNLEISDTIVSDGRLGHGAPLTQNNLERVCPDSQSFCFPSTLSGYPYIEKNLKSVSSEESGSQYGGQFCLELTQDGSQASNKSWSSDYGIFKLLNGGFVSCCLNSREGINDVPSLQTEGTDKDSFSSCGGSLLKKKTIEWTKNTEMTQSSFSEGPFLPNVRISPTLLDWGQNYLYSPSLAFLTVINTCNDSILHIYEPFTTDLQFYPCNFSEISLGPGELASICFVFFPRWLGLSSAHLILQTSSGGFFVEAKGYATESPFGIEPLLGLEISPGGRLSRNFSLFNPFDEVLYVEEITAWISVSMGHNSVETEAFCSINNFQVFDDLLFPAVKDRLVVKNGQIGSPMVAIRPHRNWDIGPHSSETLMEIDISIGFEGKIVGAFCFHLLRSSQDKSDTIMVPIEAEVDNNSAYDNIDTSVSASLEGVIACDGGETVIVISLRNNAPYLLSFVRVMEVADTEVFHIKYMEGLLLFPSTVTQVAMIYCSHLHIGTHESAPEMSNLQENCKLLILTNDSTNSQIEIPCEDILYICLGHQWLSSAGQEDESKYIESGNMRAGYLGSTRQLSSQVKVIEKAEVDELVLGNWVSQGTTGCGMSVLEDHEVLFPMILVGSYVSRWITVMNPSQHPVIMQLILNSGVIIDECRGTDTLVRPSSGGLVLGESYTPTKYGFSIPENAVTEAYVHPHDHASLGPIIFYPSDRCQWSSSALIRNNLSGVEWLSLRGFGGSLSLILHERSEPIRSIDFALKMPRSLNFSLPYSLLHMKEMTSSCSQPLVKELYAKNVGDLPLEVINIRVSGRECELDGFMIHSCGGFALEPGESAKLKISYQTDFSVAMVHRDLQLVLASGIFPMPMKASFPYDMLSSCKKSMFWMRLKRSFIVLFFVASLIFLVVLCVFPQTSALVSLDHWCKSEDGSIHTTIKSGEKTSPEHHNQRKSKLSMLSKMDHPFCSVEDTISTMQASCGRYSNGQGKLLEQKASQHVMPLMPSPEIHRQSNHLLDTPNERKLPTTAAQGSDTLEASQLTNLNVKTGKQSGRKRRKRKGLGAKLTILSEVSSSQSGNSTPSSPISPVSATTKCNWSLSSDTDRAFEVASTSFTPTADKHFDEIQASVSVSKPTVLKPEVPVKCCSNSRSNPCQEPHSSPRNTGGKDVQMRSVIDPLPMPLASTTTVALHARAPGSKLQNQKTDEAQDKGGNANSDEAQDKGGIADEFAYDIWGDHLSGLHLSVASKNVTTKMCCPSENNFVSFFVMGPQTLLTNSQEG